MRRSALNQFAAISLAGHCVDCLSLLGHRLVCSHHIPYGQLNPSSGSDLGIESRPTVGRRQWELRIDLPSPATRNRYFHTTRRSAEGKFHGAGPPPLDGQWDHVYTTENARPCAWSLTIDHFVHPQSFSRHGRSEAADRTRTNIPRMGSCE